jgi:hypothetical protein
MLFDSTYLVGLADRSLSFCHLKKFSSKICGSNGVCSNDSIHETVLSMQLQYTNFLHKPKYISVCRTITVSVQPVWPIELQGKLHLHISVQCRTATQLLPHLSRRKSQTLFCDFPNSRPANLSTFLVLQA